MAAWAGAEVSSAPVAAAATAVAAMAFFGEAMRRMKETVTGNLFVRVHGGREHAGTTRNAVGGMRRRRDPGGLVGAWRRHPEKQAGEMSAMTPFTSCGRTRRKSLVCDLALKPQVARAIGVGMPCESIYGRAS
ncbi:hypothetical protein SY2F82_03890 [Streptomyces sp. Y2F8-2]|nr:hypothetical protein SY2F82_03890 [Streptomyces sp. Y2F8-2]